MEHLVQHRLRIDRLLAGARIGAAVRTELRRRIDVVAARRAGDSIAGDVLRISGHRGWTFISTENVDVTGCPFCIAGLKRQFCTEAIRRGISPGIDCAMSMSCTRPSLPTVRNSRALVGRSTRSGGTGWYNGIGSVCSPDAARIGSERWGAVRGARGWTPPAIVRGSIMPLLVRTSRSARARCAAAE